MSAKTHSWEDLRLIRAIARGGGLSGAARILGLHHATVLRRLNAFEYRSGVVLFDRQPSGYVPTQTGEELAQIAGLIGQDVENAYRKLEGRDLRLSGTIRIATSDFLGQTLLLPVLKEFRTLHPLIKIETVISAHYASLTKRDADISLRATNNTPDHFSSTRLGRISYGLYGHKDLIKSRPERRPEQLDWIGNDHTIADVANGKWQQDAFTDAHISLRFDSLMAKFAAIRSGLGVGFLPHFLANTAVELTCLERKDALWSLDVWLMTHRDLARMNRIAAFLQTAKRCFADIDLSDPGFDVQKLLKGQASQVRKQAPQGVAPRRSNK